MTCQDISCYSRIVAIVNAFHINSTSGLSALSITAWFCSQIQIQIPRTKYNTNSKYHTNTSGWVFSQRTQSFVQVEPPCVGTQFSRWKVDNVCEIQLTIHFFTRFIETLLRLWIRMQFWTNLTWIWSATPFGKSFVWHLDLSPEPLAWNISYDLCSRKICM